MPAQPKYVLRSPTGSPGSSSSPLMTLSACEQVVAVLCVCIGVVLLKCLLRARRKRNQDRPDYPISNPICKGMGPVAVREVPSSCVTSAARFTHSDIPESDGAGSLRTEPLFALSKVADEAHSHQNGVKDEAQDEEKVKRKRRIKRQSTAPAGSINVSERIKELNRLATGAGPPSRRETLTESSLARQRTEPTLKTATRKTSKVVGRSLMDEFILAAQERCQDLEGA